MQEPDSAVDRQDGATYAIRVKGHLDPRWGAWFEGLALSQQSDGTTLMVGRIHDQAALHGVLQKVRDIGLVLLSVSDLKAGCGQLET